MQLSVAITSVGTSPAAKYWARGRTWLRTIRDDCTERQPHLNALKTISNPELRPSAYTRNTALGMPVINTVDEGLASFVANGFPELNTTLISSSNVVPWLKSHVSYK